MKSILVVADIPHDPLAQSDVATHARANAADRRRTQCRRYGRWRSRHDDRQRFRHQQRYLGRTDRGPDDQLKRILFSLLMSLRA